MFFLAGGLGIALLLSVALSEKKKPSAAEIEAQRKRDLQYELELAALRKLGGIPSPPTVSRGRWNR